MKIPKDPDDMQKRLENRIVGSRGGGFAEVIPDPERGKLLRRIKELLGLLKKKPQ